MKFIASILILIFSSTLLGCNNQKMSEVVNTNDGFTVVKTNTKVEEINSSHYIDKEEFYTEITADIGILKDKAITVNSELSQIRIDDVKNKSDTIDTFINNIDTQNKGYYITNYVCNGNFIVWIESNSKIDDLNNLREEVIYSRSLANGEIKEIIKVSYDGFEEERERKQIKELDISDDNKLVFKYSEIIQGNIFDKLVVQDLKTNLRVFSTNSEDHQRFKSIKIDGNHLVYLKDTFDLEYQKTRKLVIQNLALDEFDEISMGFDISKLDVFNNTIAIIGDRVTDKTHREFYIYDIPTGQVTARIFEGSDASKYINEKDTNNVFDNIDIFIDDRYVYLLGEACLIYDINKNVFITLSKKDNKKNTGENTEDLIYSYKAGDKVIIVKKEGKHTLYYLNKE